MSKGKKYTLWTSLFYVLLFSLVPLAEHYSPGGPCTPGGGMLLLLVTPVLAGLGLGMSLLVSLNGQRFFFGPLLINGDIFVTALLLFKFV